MHLPAGTTHSGMKIKDYFLLLFPKMDEVIRYTNCNGVRQLGADWQPTSRREFQRFLGIFFNKSFFPDMDIASFFRVGHIQGVNPGPAARGAVCAVHAGWLAVACLVGWAVRDAYHRA